MVRDQSHIEWLIAPYGPTVSTASFMFQKGADGRHLLSFQVLNLLPMLVNSRNAFEGLSVTAYR
jgi:hypothetical protein